MLNFMFLIPVAFTFCMLIVASYQLISKYTDVQRDCRTHVLNAQKILGEKLKELIDLNEPAQKLRTEEKRLRLAIQVAAIPAVQAALRIKLYANLAQQGLLRAQQEKLILSAKSQATLKLSELPRLIPGAQYSPVGLRVAKSPPLAIAQDHNPVPFFTEAQAIRVRWRIPTVDFVPDVVLKIFKEINYPLTIAGKCGATLVKKGEAWNPKLHLARF